MTTETKESTRWVEMATVALILLVVVTLAGLAGEAWWVLDLAAALKPQLALGFLVLVGVFIWFRIPVLAVVSLIGLVLNVVPIAALYSGAPGSAAEDGPVLDLMFLNTEIRDANPEALIEELEDGEHDVVVLAAATRRWADLLQEADIPYVIKARPSLGTGSEWVVLARYGVDLDAMPMKLGVGGRDALVQQTRIGDTPITILAMHPPSPVTADLAATHGDQMAAAAAWASAQDDPVVIIGDLNATPWSTDMGRLLENGGLVNSQKGFGLQASWPAILGPLGIPIDHALHGTELVTVNRSVGPSYGSDHRSLLVSVAVDEPDA